MSDSCWSCNPDMGDFRNPELSEAVAVGEEPGVSQTEESVTLEPWGMLRGLAGPARPLHAQEGRLRGARTPGGAIPYPTLA